MGEARCVSPTVRIANYCIAPALSATTSGTLRGFAQHRQNFMSSATCWFCASVLHAWLCVLAWLSNLRPFHNHLVMTLSHENHDHNKMLPAHFYWHSPANRGLRQAIVCATEGAAPRAPAATRENIPRCLDLPRISLLLLAQTQSGMVLRIDHIFKVFDGTVLLIHRRHLFIPRSKGSTREYLTKSLLFRRSVLTHNTGRRQRHRQDLRSTVQAAR